MSHIRFHGLLILIREKLVVFNAATLPSRHTLTTNRFLDDLQNMATSEILDVATQMNGLI